MRSGESAVSPPRAEGAPPRTSFDGLPTPRSWRCLRQRHHARVRLRPSRATPGLVSGLCRVVVANRATRLLNQRALTFRAPATWLLALTCRTRCRRRRIPPACHRRKEKVAALRGPFSSAAGSRLGRCCSSRCSITVLSRRTSMRVASSAGATPSCRSSRPTRHGSSTGFTDRPRSPCSRGRRGRFGYVRPGERLYIVKGIPQWRHQLRRAEQHR